MTRNSHGAVESIFRKWQSFLKNCQVFPLNCSETNQNNQSGRFPVLQEVKLEWPRSQIVPNKEHVKKHQDRVDFLDEWRGQCCKALSKLEDIHISGPEISSYIVNK